MLKVAAAIMGSFTVSGSSAVMFNVLGESDFRTDGSNVWIPFTVVVGISLFIGAGIWKIANWIRDLKDLVSDGNEDAAAAKKTANEVATSLSSFRNSQNDFMESIDNRIEKIEEHCSICVSFTGKRK